MNKRAWLSAIQLTVVSYILSANLMASERFYPSALLLMDNNFSHHVIVAEKSTHRLYIFRNDDGKPKLIKQYLIATGKKAGNKVYQGDHRTPEGIYYLTNFLTHQDLVKKHGKQGEIYGVGAFVLNYPNPIDSYYKKTGGGIWLHSTNDETRIDKGLDSRGCVVSGNTDLIEISQYIELHKTPMVVVHNLNYMDEKSWTTARKNLMDTVSSWKQAWADENIDQYISFYHPHFRNNRLQGKPALKAYKRSIFLGDGKPDIQIKNLNIFSLGDYARVTFTQEYSSKNIQDVGRKTLYLKKDQYYQWKILAENWSKNGSEIPQNIRAAFKPSQRFFSTTNPKQILGDKLLHAKNTN